MTEETKGPTIVKEIDALKASLQEMLDAYWGEGDGETPPAFILRAQLLLAE